ncbi:MAG TPA: hypothetical protein VGM73_14535 [Candidatus Didemnitutus sp.]|jgi:anti-sigma factor RsiW
MKDARFIELINLYVDRQISPEDTAELEAEIQTHAAHRRVYQQYCHMHRASKLVYESFRAHAEPPASPVAQPGSIAYFAQRRQRTRRNFRLGSLAALAAAACAAVYFGRVEFASPAANPAGAIAQHAIVPVTIPVAMVPAKAVSARQNYTALLNDVRRSEANAFTLNETAQVQPVSLFDDGVFAPAQNLSSDTRRLGPAKARTADQAAFQFQR